MIDMHLGRALLAAGACAGLVGCSLLLDAGALSDGASASDDGGGAPAEGGDDGALGGDDAPTPGDGGGDDATTATDSDALAGATYPELVLADKPVAYWRFRESGGTTAKDETANHYDGTWHGTPLFGRPGPFPGSTAVRNDTAYMSADALAAVTWPEITIEAWVAPATTGNIMWVLSFDHPDATGVSKGLSRNGGPDVFRYHDDTIADLLGQTVTAVDTYYYVVVTLDAASTVRLYVDAVGEATSTSAQRPPNPGKVSVGTQLDPSDAGIVAANLWRGNLAEIAVYDKALPAARVAAHYAAGR